MHESIKKSYFICWNQFCYIFQLILCYLTFKMLQDHLSEGTDELCKFYIKIRIIQIFSCPNSAILGHGTLCADITKPIVLKLFHVLSGTSWTNQMRVYARTPRYQECRIRRTRNGLYRCHDFIRLAKLWF